MFDDAGEVAAAAVLHDNVEDASISVDVSVVISYDVFVVQVFENISGGEEMRREIKEVVKTYTSATICFLSRSLMRSKFISFLANIYNRWLGTWRWQNGSTYQAIRLSSYFSNDTKGTVSDDIERFIQL